MKRIIAFLLLAVLLLMVNSALAEIWTCPNCGKIGNDSNFCPDCGTPRPVEEVEEAIPETTWGRFVVSDYEVGDIVCFGHYEQDGSEADGPEPIRWLVIGAEDGKLFLLSEKGLDMKRFNGSSNGEVWAGSLMRKWLNDTFLNTAFDVGEQDAIRWTEVDDGAAHANAAWNTADRVGGITEDKIFLLSYLEMSTLVSEQDRLCEPSEAIMRKGAYTETHNGHKCCWYWLRTSAYRNNAIVVTAEGGFETCYLHHDYGVVRPALWVYEDAVTPIEKSI